MIVLRNKRTLERIGEIDEKQLQFLRDQMEEESLEDQDYAITSMTLDLFSAQGADPELLNMLRRELGPHEEIVIEWDEI